MQKYFKFFLKLCLGLLCDEHQRPTEAQHRDDQALEKWKRTQHSEIVHWGNEQSQDMQADDETDQ